MKGNVWRNPLSLIVTHPPFTTLQMKQNINPVKVISEKDRIRIVNTLFNVKLQALDKELQLY